MSDETVCQGVHRFFAVTDGTVEGLDVIKIYVVVVCTVCKESHLIEHIMAKDATRLSNA